MRKSRLITRLLFMGGLICLVLLFIIAVVSCCGIGLGLMALLAMSTPITGYILFSTDQSDEAEKARQRLMADENTRECDLGA